MYVFFLVACARSEVIVPCFALSSILCSPTRPSHRVNHTNFPLISALLDRVSHSHSHLSTTSIIAM
jgi:hypothetical protein